MIANLVVFPLKEALIEHDGDFRSMARPTTFVKDPVKGLSRKIRTSMTFGVIVGKRGMFPKELVKQGRDEILKVLKELGHKVVILSEKETEFGAVSNFAEGKKCAELFKKHAEEIDGIIITLPNFGDERSIANAIRQSNLDVPVLVQAEPDVIEKMKVGMRRDSFCGKISVCANLNQFGIPFTLTASHTCAVSSDEFKDEVTTFAGVCRVVNGLRGARVGAIGARTGDFNTVRYSEKILEKAGISVETLDLSEVIGQANALATDEAVNQRIAGIKAYADASAIPQEGLEKLAKLAIVVEQWIETKDLDAIAFQCWTAIENYFGVAPCTMLSIFSNGLIPAACEVDVTGAVSMLALELASGTAAAILDWNNNYGDSEDKAVVFHCSNLPAALLTDPKIEAHFSGSFKPGSAYGAVFGRIPAGPFTFARVSTDDDAGNLVFYAGEGEFTDDPLETFGGYGVVEIPDLQELLQEICITGFEHHFAVTLGNVADIIEEAFINYLDIES